MENPIRFHDLSKLSPAERHTLFKRTESDLGRYIEPVERILKAVKEDGDLALAKFSREFDQADLNADTIKVQPEEFEKAFDSVEDDVVEAIRFAAHS
ncbi:MAG: histidinol dehydrogenase, partial [Desulfobacterales bacterium]